MRPCPQARAVLLLGHVGVRAVELGRQRQGVVELVRLERVQGVVVHEALERVLRRQVVPRVVERDVQVEGAHEAASLSTLRAATRGLRVLRVGAHALEPHEAERGGGPLVGQQLHLLLERVVHQRGALEVHDHLTHLGRDLT
jgi:hypothetical protein